MTILHVEDHASTREVVRLGLEAYGIGVVSVDRVAAARQVLTERSDVVGALVDLRLPDGSGLELYEWLSVHRPALAQCVAFVSGGDSELTRQAATLGRPMLEKPFELAALARVVAEWESAASPR